MTGESPAAREELPQLPGLLLIPNPITDRAWIVTKTVLMIFSISRPKCLRVFHGIWHPDERARSRCGQVGQWWWNKLCFWDAFTRPLAFERIVFSVLWALTNIPRRCSSCTSQGISHRRPFTCVNVSRNFSDNGPEGISGKTRPLSEGGFSAGEFGGGPPPCGCWVNILFKRRCHPATAAVPCGRPRTKWPPRRRAAAMLRAPGLPCTGWQSHRYPLGEVIRRHAEQYCCVSFPLTN